MVTLTVVAAGLAGGIIWNLVTWLFGIPSSSSHALIGGVIGSTIAAAGGSAVLWHGLVSKVVLPAVLSPIIAALVAAIGTWLLYRISRSLTDGRPQARLPDRADRLGLHGLARARHQRRAEDHGRHHPRPDRQRHPGGQGSNAPVWVIVCCALAISLGTYLGGWRVIRTLGKGLVEIESPQGMAAESASAAVILLSSQLRLLAVHHARRHRVDHRHRARQEGRRGPLERGRPDGHRLGVHPPVGGARRRGGLRPSRTASAAPSGVIVDLVLLAALAGFIFWRSRATKVDHNNVNAEWTGAVAPAGRRSRPPRPEQRRREAKQQCPGLT